MVRRDAASRGAAPGEPGLHVPVPAPARRVARRRHVGRRGLHLQRLVADLRPPHERRLPAAGHVVGRPPPGHPARAAHRGRGRGLHRVDVVRGLPGRVPLQRLHRGRLRGVAGVAERGPRARRAEHRVGRTGCAGAGRSPGRLVRGRLPVGPGAVDDQPVALRHLRPGQRPPREPDVRQRHPPPRGPALRPVRPQRRRPVASGALVERRQPRRVGHPCRPARDGRRDRRPGGGGARPAAPHPGGPRRVAVLRRHRAGDAGADLHRHRGPGPGLPPPDPPGQPADQGPLHPRAVARRAGRAGHRRLAAPEGRRPGTGAAAIDHRRRPGAVRPRHDGARRLHPGGVGRQPGQGGAGQRRPGRAAGRASASARCSWPGAGRG